MGKIIIAGIGPGSPEDITPAVLEAVREADAIVGYKYYFQFIEPFVREGCECIDTGMKKEQERAEQTFLLAEQGKTVVVISSGDAGIYGMAPLIHEMAQNRLRVGSGSVAAIEIVALPGISAFQKAASLLGAPIGHDLCIISLSDLMTPWEVIERRIQAAATGDFVTAIYNPKSHGRYWQLYRLQELFLQQRSADTPVGYVRQAGRPEQEVTVTTLGTFDPEDIDMFTVIIIGNSQSYMADGKIITPRGYCLTPQPPLHGASGTGGEAIGQQIMMESFRTIGGELRRNDYPLGHLWALLHAIHTTADFEMEQLLYSDPGAVETLYNKVKNGTLRTIVTDVTMVTSGIRKGALARLGIEAKCYLSDPRVAEMTAQQSRTSHLSPLTSEKITRTQAGIRLAVEEHPDALFAFGNAPTALMELCDLIRKGKARPAGIIAAPVGFVHVRESKHMVKPFRDIPKIIVEGRKGGSNLAATLCNAILTFDDAAQLKPGRDL
ncbi:MAG: precorrin-3B C(17)-methyltransferase [Bacteroidaceae bacterium]|nr:precorrin-3B C(17)-methyltransferase [Bacteroidaceae bacterium]